ncbi:MAG: hypothetical protein IJZ85_03940, partial [Lachnospiraceae bacterium]|nr:hypothetical protein [Lachnospiraceae bacterium]
QETRLRVASNQTRGWQAKRKTHLCVASREGLCPKKKNRPLCGRMVIQTDYECSGAFLFWESVVLLYVIWIKLSRIEV